MILIIRQDGDTPLHHAARNEHLEILRILIEKGATLEAKNNVSKEDLSDSIQVTL